MKLFIIPDIGEGVYALVSETGECLASHYCSDSCYARGDLEADRPARQEEWKRRFGEYEVMFFSEQSDITMEEIRKRNMAWKKK